ncbi:MarC family protein [Ralstonia solanacearum]|uniref:MarC family protein n=1 Tax=Ralstonia solanacearum TaxID=305 RepID=UPI0018D14E3D|nr:MarC family protein [Ralstonia solanacearum]
MEYTFASATVLLLLITDPLGNIPIFISALRPVAPERRNRVVLREVGIAFALLLVFMFFGEAFLRMMSLTDLSLQIAGGIVLFLIALRMIFPREGPADGQLTGEPFIVPLATVMLLVSQAPGRMWTWIGSLSATMAVCAVVLLSATRIQRLVGERTVMAFERLMGLILVAISVGMLLKGIRAFAHQL